MRPTGRTIGLAGCWAVSGLLPALNLWLPVGLQQPDWQPVLEQGWIIGSSGLLMLLLLDALSLRRTPAIHVERQHADNLALGIWSPVLIRIRHEFRRPVPLVFHDHIPASAEADHPCQHDRLLPRQSAEYRYRLRLNRRGDYTFGQLDLLLTSRLGFWQRRLLAGDSTRLRVYPDYAAVSHYAMLSMEQQAGQIGIRKQQRRGEGKEFHQLREFRQGDSLRQIDWNATARQRKLVSKDYQDEQDQQILFLLDCGRRMRSQDGELSHLDHALNALLLMSYAALKQGDAVGMMAFGDAERWLKPAKGVAQMTRLLHSVYDLETSTRASDHTTAAQQLLTRQHKRSLIVLLTNLQDDDGDELLPALRLLQRQHLVLLANLEDPALLDVLHQPVTQFTDALRHAGTHSWLAQHRQTSARFNRQGVITLDCTPRQLPVQLVNRYFDIKRQGLL